VLLGASELAPVLQIGGRVLETVGSTSGWVTGMWLPAVGARSEELKAKGYTNAEALAGGAILAAGDTALQVGLIHGGSYLLGQLYRGATQGIPNMVRRGIESRQMLDVEDVLPGVKMSRADLRDLYEQSRNMSPAQATEHTLGVYGDMVNQANVLIDHLQGTGQIRQEQRSSFAWRRSASTQSSDPTDRRPCWWLPQAASRPSRRCGTGGSMRPGEAPLWPAPIDVRGAGA
jgi:hypothetical protein